MALEITDNNFQEKVVNSGKLSVIDFWAEWCGPCRMMNPIIENVKKTNPNKPPNEEDLRELMNYIKTWREDVDRHFKFSTFMLYEWYYPIRSKIKWLWKKH